jgi:UDP-glucose 4-epimerase
VTITTTDMTRFLLSLDQAVDTIFACVREGRRGETYIPRVPSAKVVDIAEVLIDGRPVKTVVTGIRPGEKVHEILVSEEERYRTLSRGNYYAIQSVLPEIRGNEPIRAVLSGEYSSADNVLPRAELLALLGKHRLMLEDVAAEEGEVLR